MTLFEKMLEAAKNGTQEEFRDANRVWYEAAVQTEVCTDCGTSTAPLHPWLGHREPLCEECDEIRRRDYDHYLDEIAHQRMLEHTLTMGRGW